MRDNNRGAGAEAARDQNSEQKRGRDWRCGAVHHRSEELGSWRGRGRSGRRSIAGGFSVYRGQRANEPHANDGAGGETGSTTEVPAATYACASGGALQLSRADWGRRATGRWYEPRAGATAL